MALQQVDQQVDRIALGKGAEFVALLEESLAVPEATRRSSALVVAGVVVGALAIGAAGVALAVLIVRAIWTATGG